MATLINSVSQLRKILETKIQQALILTQEEIYDVIYKHIEEYYEEEVFSPPDRSEPDVYIRTFKFLNSLIKTKIIQTGNSLSCTVQIDDDYLRYKYPGDPSWGKNVPATGADVVSWANESSHLHTHGYTVYGESSFWDDALDELGGKQGILNLMKKNLKAVGVPIA